ncbi:hypothetical protein F-VV57_0384 [Faustovirus]|nr:hypothetical protein F-VV57_0384 [Faustovirus]QJX73652.1 hypothetical protein F-VV63_0386 [Faustovirus]
MDNKQIIKELSKANRDYIDHQFNSICAIITFITSLVSFIVFAVAGLVLFVYTIALYVDINGSSARIPVSQLDYPKLMLSRDGSTEMVNMQYYSIDHINKYAHRVDSVSATIFQAMVTIIIAGASCVIAYLINDCIDEKIKWYNTKYNKND